MNSEILSISLAAGLIAKYLVSEPVGIVPRYVTAVGLVITAVCLAFMQTTPAYALVVTRAGDALTTWLADWIEYRVASAIGHMYLAGFTGEQITVRNVVLFVFGR